MDKHQVAQAVGQVLVTTAIKAGSGIAGGVIGGAIGSVGGPAGAALGAKIGYVVGGGIGDVLAQTNAAQRMGVWAGQNGLRAFEAMGTRIRRAEGALEQARDRMFQFFEPFKSKMRLGGVLA
jgi:hypothetical protein